MDNGYLGIALDAFGNFANQADQSNADCPAFTGLVQNKAYPEAVTVRGPGEGESGYCIQATSALQVGAGNLGFPGTGGWDGTDDNNPSGAPLDNPTLAPSAGAAESTVRSHAQIPVEVILNPASNDEIVESTEDNSVEVDPGDWAVLYQTTSGGSWQVLTGTLPTVDASDYPSGWINPTSGLPYQMTFGWTSSTGSANELHEVNQVEVHPTTPAP